MTESNTVSKTHSGKSQVLVLGRRGPLLAFGLLLTLAVVIGLRLSNEQGRVVRSEADPATGLRCVFTLPSRWNGQETVPANQSQSPDVLQRIHFMHSSSNPIQAQWDQMRFRGAESGLDFELVRQGSRPLPLQNGYPSLPPAPGEKRIVYRELVLDGQKATYEVFRAAGNRYDTHLLAVMVEGKPLAFLFSVQSAAGEPSQIMAGDFEKIGKSLRVEKREGPGTEAARGSSLQTDTRHGQFPTP